MKIPMVIAAMLIATEVLAAQTVDTTATVICGKSEQPTPCVLILNRHVPSYELIVKKGDGKPVILKVERFKDKWEVMGEVRKERLIEVVADIDTGDCSVIDPRLQNVSKDLIPDGCDGLIIKAVEAKR